jgi:predicted ATPase
VDLPERQRTLRATVEWSVELLNDDERSMLSTLSVFVDGWTIDAAAHVGDLGEDKTLDLIEALALHSLVRVDPTNHGSRFRMLETVREFVAEQSQPNIHLTDVAQRHANYFRYLAERARGPLRGMQQAEWAGRLQTEAANLSAAVGWFLARDLEPLPHMFRILWLFWSMRDHLVEVRSWMDQLVPAASLDEHGQAELFWAAAATAVQLGDDSAALAARKRLEPLPGGFDDSSSWPSHIWSWHGFCRWSTTSTAHSGRRL